MEKVFNKRLIRDLKEHLSRWLALFLLTAMGLYIVISMVGASEIIIVGTETKGLKNKVEDGCFSVLMPLSEEQKSSLNKSADIEAMFSADIETENGNILRLMKTRSEINLIDLDCGRTATANCEVVFEKRFCEENEIVVGDNIELGGKNFEVVGIGSVPDYDMPLMKMSDVSAKSRTFGLAFVTDNQYDEMIFDGQYKESYDYSYCLKEGVTHDELKQKIKNMDFGFQNLISFIKSEDNTRIAAAADDTLINKQIGLAAGVVVIALFTYVISVFVIHQIQSESSVIGTLYSLGVKKSELIAHYITLPAVVTFLGGLLGTFLGFSPLGIDVQMLQSYSYFSLPIFDRIYPPYLIIYGVIMPPIVCIVVTFAVIDKRLSYTALSLIRNEQKQRNFSKIRLHNIGFIRSFQLRQILKEMRTGLTVVMGMIISLMVFMLGFNCYALCTNIKTDMDKSIASDYMYHVIYQDNVSADGETCYSEVLSKTHRGFTHDITVMGIKNSSRYFDIGVKNDENSIVIGKSVAEKYGLKTGGSLALYDSANDKEYRFTIDGVCDYAVGLTVFMDIDSMCRIFNKDNGYYNTVLSDEPIEFEESRLIAVTERKDIESSSEIFKELMMPMVIMLTIVSAIVFCVVMFLMQNVMIDRAGLGISLLKIFGYRTKELKRLYLNGNLYIVVIGALIGIPLSKKLSDIMYPYLIANTACGMNLKLSWYWYMLIFAVIIIIYLIINSRLTLKLKRISAVEILKNRE